MRIGTADLNGDGNADLVVLPVDPTLEPAPILGSAGNRVSIFLGDGNGAFKALPPFSATLSNFTEDGGFPSDLNCDHVPDLILTKQQYSFKTKLPLMRWMILLGR
jgi:hypothetical protein